MKTTKLAYRFLQAISDASREQGTSEAIVGAVADFLQEVMDEAAAAGFHRGYAEANAEANLSKPGEPSGEVTS